MNEEIEFILDSAKEAMNNAIEHLIKELRTGLPLAAMVTSLIALLGSFLDGSLV